VLRRLRLEEWLSPPQKRWRPEEAIYRRVSRTSKRFGMIDEARKVGYTHNMIVIADARRRVTLPKPAHPGDAFALEATGEGHFLLSRLEKSAAKVKLSREQGFLVASTGRPITMAQTRALMDEFP